MLRKAPIGRFCADLRLGASILMSAGSATALCAGPQLLNDSEAALGALLKDKWRWEEGKAGNKPPSDSWPPVQPSSDDLPRLRRLLKECGGESTAACSPLAFQLATGLLGSSLSVNELAATVPAEDAADGVRLMRRLAEAGDPDGMCALGNCLVDGRGVPADEAAAAAWFRRAAEAGHMQAQYEIGCLHFRGDGVPEDDVAAVRWFRAAAAQQHAGAMYLLGDCLLEGVGVAAADRASALEVLTAAGELGHRGARSRVLALLAPTADPAVDAGIFTDASRQTLCSRP